MRLTIISSKVAMIVLLMSILGCPKTETSKLPFIHRNAVFQAFSGGDTATSPVEKNKSNQTQKYAGAMSLQQGAIRLRYTYVGTAFCPLKVSSYGEEWSDADVYVLNITEGDSETETIPFVYKGVAITVVDRPNLKVTIEQE